MSSHRDRAAELIAAGRLPVPGRGPNGLALMREGENPRAHPYAPEDFDLPEVTAVQVLLGFQPSACYLYLIDLDSHKEGQDADAARATLEHELPLVSKRIVWRRSRSGRGWHGFFETYRKLPAGKLFDAEGRHIGEFLGKDTDRILDPGDIDVPRLNYEQVEQLFQLVRVQGAAEGAETWSAYERAGRRYTHGWQRETPNLPRLGVFLSTFAGDYGRRFAELRAMPRGDRSGMIARLAQTVLLHVHKLDSARDFLTLCRRAKALIMQAEGFGKADERGYNWEKDVNALIAKIVSGAPRADGGKWTVPFWVKGSADRPEAIEAAPETEETPRRRGRPAGSGGAEKRRTKLRRALTDIAPDEFGRRVYTVDALAEHLGVPRRTVQADLAWLRGDEASGRPAEIRTAQVAGNGRPYVVLTPHFGGANNSIKPDKNGPQNSCFGGAIKKLAEGAPMPQTDDSAVQCNKEERSPEACAPPPAAPAAPAAPSGAQACGAFSPPGPGTHRGRLGELVSEGFDAYDGAPLHRRKALVLRYVADNGGADADPDFVSALYGAERDRRSMAMWSKAKLRRSLRIYEVKVDAARDGSGDFLWLWRRLYRDASAELARRPAEPGRKPRQVCEVLPNPREAGERRQAELWAQIAPVLAEMRSPVPTPPTFDAPAVPASPAPPEPEYDAAGIADRLIGLKLARESASAKSTLC